MLPIWKANSKNTGKPVNLQNQNLMKIQTENGNVRPASANTELTSSTRLRKEFFKNALTRKLLTLIAILGLGSSVAKASLLINGSLDSTYQQEIVPGFFLPKPSDWINEASRSISGPYEDELSSEPWAGPAPTPVTPSDQAVFFKAFSGGGANGPATANFYQDAAATPGMTYTLTGWAGAEANYMAQSSLFAIDFLDGGGSLIPLSSMELDLVAAGLFVPNGQAFNYKEYSVSATAPANAASVRARVSMIGGTSNPMGGGQAFVVDDFVLAPIPEPGTFVLLGLGIASLVALRRRS